MERDTFIFHRKWYEALKDLCPEMKADAFDSICKLALYGQKTESENAMIKMAMSFITPELEAACEKWIKTKEARSEAGRKGGLQRAANASESKQMQANASNANQSQANQADNVIPLLNVNVNDSFLNTHTCVMEGWKEDKDFILEIGRMFLKKGILQPCEEARAFIQYNDKNGWRNNKGAVIRDKKGWADKWKTKSEKCRVVAKYADGYIYLLEACKMLDDTHMDALRSFTERENEIVISLTSQSMCDEIAKCSSGERGGLIHEIRKLYFEDKDLLITIN